MKIRTLWPVHGLMLLLMSLFLTACDKKPQNESNMQHAEQQDETHAAFPRPDDPALLAGYDVFTRVCSHCHVESEYAPVINHPAEWAKRLNKHGRDTLLKHAIDGYGDMSPKGGRRGKDLTDEQVAAALDYILGLLPEKP